MKSQSSAAKLRLAVLFALYGENWTMTALPFALHSEIATPRCKRETSLDANDGFTLHVWIQTCHLNASVFPHMRSEPESSFDNQDLR